MKRLAALVFCSTFMLGADPVYFLPDEADDALGRLRSLIGQAVSEVVIVTPRLDSRPLVSAIGKAAERNVPITLVTSGNPDDAAAALVRFASVDYRVAEGLLTERYEGALSLTLIRIDRRYECLGTLPFDQTRFEHDIALLRCSAYDGNATGRTYEHIMRRSHPYLRP